MGTDIFFRHVDSLYLNPNDVKHVLKIRHYFRYADDFVIVHYDAGYLDSLVGLIQMFLRNNLGLDLHRRKMIIRKFRQGVDFLGYVILPYHIVLRTKTKKRMFRKLFEKREALEGNRICLESYRQSVQPYLGMLKHCNGYGWGNILRNNFGAGFPLVRE